MLDNNKEEDDKIPDFAGNYVVFFYDTAMGELEEDAEGHDVEDDLGQMLRETEEGCETEKESRERSEAYVGGLQNIVVPRLQIRPKKVGYHIGIVAMEGIKWFVCQGIRGVAETYKKLTH